MAEINFFYPIHTSRGCGWSWCPYAYFTLRAHCIFFNMRSVKYQPIFQTSYFTLHRARVLNNIVLTTVIEKAELEFVLRSVEQVRYVITTYYNT